MQTRNSLCWPSGVSRQQQEMYGRRRFQRSHWRFTITPVCCYYIIYTVTHKTHLWSAVGHRRSQKFVLVRDLPLSSLLGDLWERRKLPQRVRGGGPAENEFWCIFRAWKNTSDGDKFDIFEIFAHVLSHIYVHNITKGLHVLQTIWVCNQPSRSTQPSTLCGMAKRVSSFGLSSNKWRWWM